MKFFASLLLSVVVSTAYGQNINEIRIDQAGADNDEYFEIFHTPSTSLVDLIITLVNILIEGVEHGFLSFKAKTELTSKFDIARKPFCIDTLIRIHRTPPGKGSATVAKVVVSTLV